MNVLTFVMTILMLLSMMTYVRLETYRSFIVSQKQFELYMTSIEKKIFSEMAEKRYKETPVQTKDSQQTGPKTGSPRLSWSILLNAEERAKEPARATYITEVSKKLMQQQFSSFPLFQKEFQENPAVLDLLLATIMEVADALPKDRKIKQISDLIALDLQDSALNHLFYTMIKTTPIDAIPKQKTELSDETEEPEEEMPPSQNSICLLDHLIVAPKKTRPFLASRALLRAILPDETSVSAFLKKRYEIYHRLLAGELNSGQASSELKIFLTNQYPFMTDVIFDFRVSKVNPRTYE